MAFRLDISDSRTPYCVKNHRKGGNDHVSSQLILKWQLEASPFTEHVLLETDKGANKSETTHPFYSVVYSEKS